MERLSHVDLLKKNPEDIPPLFHEVLEIEIPVDLNSQGNRDLASESMTLALSYCSYFTEMEAMAKIYKRQAKAKKQKDEFERLLGLEELFCAYKEACRNVFDNITRMITLKKVEQEELRLYGVL